MNTCRQDQFFGPVLVYVHKEGSEFHAYVDPFFVIGTGKTVTEALHSANELLVSYFLAVSEELSKHGSRKVQVLNPLDAESKRGAVATFQGMIFAQVRRVTSFKPECLPLQPQPMNRIAKYLMTGEAKTVRMAGLQPIAAGA